MGSFVGKKLNDFGQLYSRYKDQEPIAQQILQGQHYYFSNLSFDPLSGEPLPQRMSYWVSREEKDLEDLEDRFTSLTDYSADAIRDILLKPRQMIERVYEMTPVYLAQRLDNRSVQWLSRKPGNNLREKLASNPHILASARKMSLDTLENRLLKAFLIRIQRLFLERQETGIRLKDSQEFLVDLIQKNLSEDEFMAIKPWQHLPPNNVLLQDKQYRKVWRSWQLLNCLEDNCEEQQANGIASGFGLFSALLKYLAKAERCLLLDQAWQFKSDVLSGGCVDNNYDILTEVLILDLGNNKVRDYAKISPSAELVLTLTGAGNIQVKRRPLMGEVQSWNFEFRSSGGLIEVKERSDTKLNNQDWQRAIPENFPDLVKQIIKELLPGEIHLRLLTSKQVRKSSDFVSVLFEGASCELQEDEKFDSIGPYFIDNLGLDCRRSMSFSADEVIFSAKELAQVSDAPSSRQIGEFVEVLTQAIEAKRSMHYLVADHYSDFETNELRREMNRHFSNANPLPQSIAAVYDLLDDQQFRHGDLIMVLSSDSTGAYATPVYYYWNEELDEEYLERHPSIRISVCQNERELLQEALIESGLPEVIAKRFIELYSYREIISGRAQLVLYDGGAWYCVPEKLDVNPLTLGDDLLKEAYSLQRRKEKVYFLSVSAAIKQSENIRPTQWLISNLLSGSQRLLKRQYAQPHKVFWKDHLPQLMTRLPVEGIEQNFYFVGNQTSVRPERGRAINIPIDTPFTLPPGREDIGFTIYQGQGSNQQEFSLLLSLRQPLKKDCICKLTLTYTYGDEQPYKLRFSPIGKEKPFNYVEAQWGKKLDNNMNRVTAIPIFPNKLTFEGLYQYMGKGQKERNIIDWLERNFNQLDEIYQFILHGRNKERFNFSYSDIHWVPEKDFGFYNSHPDYSSGIFVHKGEFKGIDTLGNSQFSGEISIRQTPQGEKVSLKNIKLQGELTDQELEKIKKSWRFPMLVFSEQGRSFTDEDIPVSLRNKGERAIEQARELLLVLKGSGNEVLEQELKMFLSYCHELMPSVRVEELLEAVKNKKTLLTESNWFKYALGNCNQQWQKQLLTSLLNPEDDTGGTRAVTLEIISVAMWRDPMLIHQLSAEEVRKLAYRLDEYLQAEINQLKPKDSFFKWNSFILRLELLLALLRTRESSDPEIQSILALDSPISNALLATIEKITDKQGVALTNKLQESKVVARVKLAVDKPAGYHRTPDLLYALKLYLSGDDGADQITITELDNDSQ